MLNETGDFSKWHGPGRARTVQTPALIEAAKAEIAKNSRQSMWWMACDHQVSEYVMRNLIKKNLGL